MELSQCLDTLDVNKYDKEIILFLASIDHADAKTIYQKTNVPKGRIYSVINGLIEKGFVQVIPTNPKKYRIENIRESIKTYLENKRALLREKITEVEQMEVRPTMFHLERNAPSVYSFTGREEHLNALISLRSRAKRKLIQIAPVFVGTFTSNLALQHALHRGVKTKIIVRKITSDNRKQIQECLRLGAEIRVLDSSGLLYFLVRDGEECILGLEDYRNNEERLNIISRNKELVSVFEQYFAASWKKARPITS